MRCGELHPNALRESILDSLCRIESEYAVDATIANQALPCRAWRNRSWSYSMLLTERLGRSAHAPRFPLPQKNSSALVPPSALPLDELLEQRFPLILTRGQT